MWPADGFGWTATLSLVTAAAAGGHALVYKRDPRSATLWVLVIGLLPLAGPLLYLLFGINRYQRRARKRSRSGKLRPGVEGAGDLPVELPEALAGLSRLIGRVTGLPLTAGNRITPLFGGAQAYPAMLEGIDAARFSIVLASYIFDGRGIGRCFVDGLQRAQARGVRVRVLIDDVYARLLPWSAYTPLRRSGVRVAAFNPTLLPARLHAANLRNHRKILVIDGQVGFTGGMNIYSPYWRPEAPEEAWRDLHFRLEGPVVEHLADSFAADWFDTTGERLDPAFWGGAPVPDMAVDGGWARGIEAGPDETLDRMRWTFMGALSAAQHSVRIWTPYFVPDQPMIAALNTAALRGVRIDLLIPERSDHMTVQWAARAHYWQVLEHGARIFERPGPFDHTKLMLVDDRWVCLGSANWDARSLRLNFEFNVEVYDRTLCAVLAAAFDTVRAESRRITAGALSARPLPIKLRDGLARLFTPVL